MKSNGAYGLVKSLVIIVICGMIVLWGVSVFGQEWTAEQKEVWEFVKTEVELSKRGDLEGLLALCHDNIISWWGIKDIPYDKELLTWNWKGWFNYDLPTTWELKPVSIKVSGNVASVMYYYNHIGEKIKSRGRKLETLVKENGKWLIFNSLSASCDKLPSCNFN